MSTVKDLILPVIISILGLGLSLIFKRAEDIQKKYILAVKSSHTTELRSKLTTLIWEYLPKKIRVKNPSLIIILDLSTLV